MGRRIDRDVVAREQVRQRSDVVLVAMGEDHSAQVTALGEKTELGDDDVDAEMVLAGKHDAGVDHDAVGAAAIEHHVHPELAEAAERYYFNM
jgi:hypothetical protein